MSSVLCAGVIEHDI